MKLILRLFFLAFSITIFAQNRGEKVFKFNKLATYIIEKKEKDSKKSVFFNTGDSNYYMTLYKIDDVIFANLFSLKENKVHFYQLLQNLGNKAYNFQYLYTTKFFKTSRKSTYEFTKENDNTLRLDIYRNKRKKEIIETHLMKIVPAKEDFFNAYQYAIFNPLSSEFNIDYTENVQISEVEVVCNNIWGSKISLVEFIDVNLELKIPNE